VPEPDLRLAAIVPATDAPQHLEECLAAIRRASEGPDEVIVVTEPGGAGPAAARNAGAAHATAEILVFVDSDVRVHADAFARIRRRFEGDVLLAAVFGSYDAAPAAPQAVSQFRNLLHHHVHQEGAGSAASFWAGLGAIRRAAFEAIGGFDEHRFARPSVEDIELGARLHARGERIELDPSILGTHLKRWTLAGMVRTDVRDRGIPWTRLLLNGESSPTGLNLGGRHRASAALSLLFLVAAFTGRRATAAAAATGVVTLNRSFYRLVLHSSGRRNALLAPPLHVLHLLTGVAAFAVGIASHLRERLRG
jgi:hypothetical protein